MLSERSTWGVLFGGWRDLDIMVYSRVLFHSSSFVRGIFLRGILKRKVGG